MAGSEDHGHPICGMFAGTPEATINLSAVTAENMHLGPYRTTLGRECLSCCLGISLGCRHIHSSKSKEALSFLTSPEARNFHKWQDEHGLQDD